MKASDFSYVLGNFAREFITNPRPMARECARFFRQGILRTFEKMPNGILFETHCHTDFSSVDKGCPELSDVIDLISGNGIGIISITDHGNTNAFDSLRNGSYDLNRKRNSREYELETSKDGRYLVIHVHGTSVEHLLLRSAEYKTDKGEVGLHGFEGTLPREGMPLEDTIKRTSDNGGWVNIHHPYFMTGLGFNGKKYIETAVKAGAIAIEKNGTEIPPQIYSPVRAEMDAKDFGISLVYGGDAHRLHMYGMSGIAFMSDDFAEVLGRNNDNYADAVKELVAKGYFKGYFNYITPKQWKEFFLNKPLSAK